MRISDAEVKKALQGIAGSDVDSEAEALRNVLGVESEEDLLARDTEMVKDLTKKVLEMPDREEMVASLKARIEAGEYHPSAEEIVDVMVRRAIADKIR